MEKQLKALWIIQIKDIVYCHIHHHSDIILELVSQPMGVKNVKEV